jgi:hypothetical protein
MRAFALGCCLFATACSGQVIDSPTSPSVAAVAPGQANAMAGTHLPFKGTISGTTNAEIDFPVLTLFSEAEGVASHLGHFKASFVNAGLLGNPETSGTWKFTAANGDALAATIHSVADPRGPLSSEVTTEATIVEGTGRFAGATGTFTVIFVEDHSNVPGVFSGSFEGHINLNR